MSRPISNASLKRQIEREGPRWGLTHMTVDGQVLVAEDQRFVLPTFAGVNYMETIRRDITAVSMDYPWSSMLRNRVRREERRIYTRAEIRHAMEQKAAKARIDDAYHELEADIRRADKQAVQVRVK